MVTTDLMARCLPSEACHYSLCACKEQLSQLSLILRQWNLTSVLLM